MVIYIKMVKNKVVLFSGVVLWSTSLRAFLGFSAVLVLR